MKNLKISKLVLSLLLCAACLTGCGSKKETVYVDDGDSVGQETPYQIVEDKYFVKSGKSDYVIVIPENSDEIVTTASQELRNFFNEATGIRPAVYKDNETLPAGAKIISLGETAQASERVSEGEKAVVGGYRIVSEGEDLFIKGGDSYGVLWGVYDLLGYMFNYEFYKKDVYDIDRNVTELNFFTVDHTVTPNVPHRTGYSALSEYNSSITALRYRLQSEWTIAAGTTHNSFIALDPEKYNDSADSENYHPSWYTANVDQLCYTAAGDESEHEKMTDVASDYFVELLTAEPTKTYVYFQMQDTRTWCECNACKEAEEKYNARSAALLITCQDIHEKIVAKLSAKGDDRNVKVVPLLYNSTESVPVVKDGQTGKYKLSDESLDFSGVTPLWANLSTKEHGSAYKDDNNKAAMDMLDKLNCAFEEFWLWDYGVNFNDYLVPFDVFNNLGEDFKVLEDYNVGLHLYQCDHTAQNSTAFGALKLYLISKLAWDANCDVEELTDKFFNAVYGAGSDSMRKIYDQFRALSVYNSVDHGDVLAWDHSVYSSSMVRREYYPKGILNGWLEELELAMQSIEPLKATDPLQYEVYEKNISAEGVFIKYIYAMIYLTNNDDESINFKVDLYREVERLNFYQVREGGGIWDLAVSLGIAAYLS